MVTNLNVTKVALAVHKLEMKLNFKFEYDIINSKVEKLVHNPSKIWKKRISGSSNFLWTWIEAGLLSVVKNSLLKDLEGKTRWELKQQNVVNVAAISGGSWK